MPFRITWIPFLLLSMLSLKQSVHGQHYFFIEADAQQPFYVRWNGTLLSSSAGGFLLVSKVEEEKILMTIGFPMNKFPECNFELDAMNRDRGFQLKNFGEKGWGLFDRTSLQIIMPVISSSEKLIVVAKQPDNSFGAVLSEVTGDSTLQEKKKESNPVTLPPPKKQLMAVSTPIRDSLIKDDRVKKDVISSLIMQENDEVKIFSFEIKNSDGKRDTVIAEISKPMVKPVLVLPPPVLETEKEKTTQKTVKAVRVPLCDKPFADTKDIRNLQRRILGSSDAKEQVAVVVKAYRERCYNTRQTMDLGWMVTDEEVRLHLFEALKGMVSDPDQYGQLETVFLKDENIKAFRKMLGKN